MPQNKNKLIELFIGNISNAIVHNILEKAIDKEEIAEKYRKELITSFEVAKKYREKINPINTPLPIKEKFENDKNLVSERNWMNKLLVKYLIFKSIYLK